MSRYFLVKPHYIEEPEFKRNLEVIGRLGELGNVEFRNIRKTPEEEYESIPMICEGYLTYQDTFGKYRLGNNYVDVITGKRYWGDTRDFGPLSDTNNNVALTEVKELSVGEVADILRSLAPNDIERYVTSRGIFDMLMSLAYKDYEMRKGKTNKDPAKTNDKDINNYHEKIEIEESEQSEYDRINAAMQRSIQKMLKELADEQYIEDFKNDNAWRRGK